MARSATRRGDARFEAGRATTLLPDEGQVLGIDVGFSATRKTTCFCHVSWTKTSATWSFRATTCDASERAEAIATLLLPGCVAAVAIDGPLTPSLEHVTHYRAAEAMLSRGALQKRGKPGQTSAPVGQRLHHHATTLARLVLGSAEVMPAQPAGSVRRRAVVEAFPNLYLAALVPEPELPALKRNATDRYWQVLVDRSDRLTSVLERALPGKRPGIDLAAVRDHEQRAGVVCAMTALAVAAGRYVAVGDPADGDIILPARSEWGLAADGTVAWLEPVLLSNLASVRTARTCHANHRDARVIVRYEQELGPPWTSTQPSSRTSQP